MKAKLTLEIMDDLEHLGDCKKTQSYSAEANISIFQLTSLIRMGADPVKHLLQSLTNELESIIKTEV